MKRYAFIAVAITLAVTIGVFLPAESASAALPAWASPEALPMIGLAGMVVNQANLSALFKGFKTIFNNAFAGAESQYKEIAMEVPSTTSQEVYAWLGSTTRFREWLGDRVIQNLKAHNFTIVNKSFENTVGVPREAIDDDQYGVYSPLIAQLGQDAKTHPDELVFALLKAGFSGLCYDGQNFFDTDHPVVGADGTIASVSNSGGGSGTAWYLLDTSKIVRPIILQKRKDYNFVPMDSDKDENVFMRKEFIYGVDARANTGYGLWQLAYASKQTLDATSYGAARAALMEMKGDNGKPLGVRPTLLVVPPSLEAKGLEILQAEKNAAGATNIYRNTAKLLASSWLA